MNSRIKAKTHNPADWPSHKRKEAEVRKRLYGHRLAPVRVSNPRGTLR